MPPLLFCHQLDLYLLLSHAIQHVSLPLNVTLAQLSPVVSQVVLSRHLPALSISNGISLASSQSIHGARSSSLHVYWV